MNMKIFMVCTLLVLLSLWLYFAFDGIISFTLRNVLLTVFLVIVYLCFQDASQDMNKLNFPFE